MHFFWGSFDLAVTRFSGRPAPRKAGRRQDHARGVFARSQQRRVLARRRAPDPAGVLQLCRARAGRLPPAPVTPQSTYFNEALGGFYLHYDDLRKSPDPEQTLLDYCRSTYEAAADNGKWDRAALERNA